MLHAGGGTAVTEQSCQQISVLGGRKHLSMELPPESGALSQPRSCFWQLLKEIRDLLAIGQHQAQESSAGAAVPG